MIRGDEPWLGRNVLSQSPIQAAVVVAPVILVPDGEAVGHHLSVVGGRQQVPTGPKVRRDAAERGQESLRVPDRLEAFHRPLALPDRLVRVLGAIFQVLRPAMLHRRHELGVRHLVAGELVGDDRPGHVLQALEQAAERTSLRLPRFGATGPECRARCRAGRPSLSLTAKPKSARAQCHIDVILGSDALVKTVSTANRLTLSAAIMLTTSRLVHRSIKYTTTPPATLPSARGTQAVHWPSR